ncbi:MAG: OmpA family protein [Gammaproteobacteria bacterium]|nr:OmpA family protein [Gammaproteobacteria bacterium]
MKHDYHIGRLIASLAVGMLFANAAFAHEAGKANDSYVGDSSKHLITHSTGDCVRTGSWKKEDQTVDCGAVPVAKAPPPPPPPPPQPSYESFTLAAEALFDHDKSVLKPAGKAALHTMDEKIKGMGASVFDIDVVGHTDSDGTAEYNQALSIRRATSVKNFMVSEGLDAGIIDVSGKGESSPVADNRTREGRALNRRVEIRVGVKRKTN